MKMKKNTTSILSDVFVLLFCLCGSAVSLWQFWNDLNTTLSKINEKPVASITFKYKVSQRKFIDRLVWDRLQQNSSLYNGDTIRTADNAQATIHFSDNNLVELGANSIIQIFVDKNGAASLDFASGELYVDSLASAGSMVVRSGSAAITLEPGTAIAAAVTGAGQTGAQSSADNAKLSLQLVSGAATFVSQSGAQQALREGSALAVDKAGIREQLITVTSPLPQSRFLKQQGSTLPVAFTWQTAQLAEGSQVILETASDKNFTTLEEQIAFTRIQNITLNMPSGIRYWRLYVRTADGAIADSLPATGRIQILDAPPPEPIVPAQYDSFKYRTRLSQIRFMWSGNEYATSYLFEVAANPQMQNPVISQRTTQISSIITLPGAGRWYWRVTPSYAQGSDFEPISSRVTSFDIIQSGELIPPLPSVPENNSFINTADSTQGQKAQTVFSWKYETEAVLYTLRLAKNESLTDGVIERKTADNWYTAFPQTDGITNGRWYWAVNCTDSEGNVSAFSKPQTFSAVDGEMIFHAVFPPDGYVIADSRTRDMRFTWKKNFDDPLKLQIAASAGFERPVYDELLAAQALSTDGKQLAAGLWYWRLVSLTPEGTIAYETEARHLTVVPPLGATRITVPQNGELIAVKPDQALSCSWQAVTGADYYQINLYAANGETPLFTEQLYGQTQALIPSSSLANGSYRLTVQALADETAGSSRRSGLLSEQRFSFKKIFPAELVFPADGSRHDGLSAMLSPASVRWNSADTGGESEFILAQSKSALPSAHKQGTRSGIVYRRDNPSQTFTLPALKSGTYWWTVTAKTADGFDISAEQPRSFVVEPIPPLKAAQGLLPQTGTVFDAAYLSKTVSATLSWQPVSGATEFEVTLLRVSESSQGQKQSPVTRIRLSADNTSYTIEDLGELDEGNFVWTVEGLSLTPDGQVLRQGTPVQAAFSIRLPATEGILLQKPGELYGN